ncbi:MAG: hypothetical protein JRF49_09120, partial [Deltaproteobacteria bacterium]|nr:hypothetical protein [Deltaproteobacteria bacterium]
TTDKETLAQGPAAESAVYKKLAEAGGFTETVNLNDPQIAPVLKINHFDNSRFVFRKKLTATNSEELDRRFSKSGKSQETIQQKHENNK